jgi:hypothetical protein
MSGSRTLKLSILADVDNLKKNLDAGSKEVEGFGGKLEKFGKVAAAAFAAAAVAAAAYAGKLAVEGVKAAIEDEAAQNRLANALKNVTGATEDQIAAVEQQILKTSLATGVSDEKLRPALQRLATATGSVSESQKLLSLALDISAATGKDVEAVSNALGKAYEGNTAALGRLGIGLSSAEIKSLGLDGTMNQLAETFRGAATVQANTLEGQIARLKVTFDETKEAVGAALLPTLQKLLDYFVNVVIPNFIRFKDAAIKPVQDAIERNKDALMDLWTVLKDYVIPIIVNGFGKALQVIGKIAGGVLDVIGAVVSGIKSAVNFAIDAINALINAYNKIPILPDIPTISKPSLGSPSTPNISSSSVAGVSIGSTTGGAAATTSGSTSGASAVKVPTPTLIEQITAQNAFNQIASGRFDPSAIRRADERGAINITVNGAIDPASTARQIADILNSEASASGSFTGLGISRFATRVE